MKSPTFEQMRVAALANVGVWSQVSEAATGRRMPGVVLSGAAMYLAHRNGVAGLPPIVRECVLLLCLPGSVVTAEQQAKSACCEACSKGK